MKAAIDNMWLHELLSTKQVVGQSLFTDPGAESPASLPRLFPRPHGCPHPENHHSHLPPLAFLCKAARDPKAGIMTVLVPAVTGPSSGGPPSWNDKDIKIMIAQDPTVDPQHTSS